MSGMAVIRQQHSEFGFIRIRTSCRFGFLVRNQDWKMRWPRKRAPLDDGYVSISRRQAQTCCWLSPSAGVRKRAGRPWAQPMSHPQSKSQAKTGSEMSSIVGDSDTTPSLGSSSAGLAVININESPDSHFDKTPPRLPRFWGAWAYFGKLLQLLSLRKSRLSAPRADRRGKRGSADRKWSEQKTQKS
jgi:hypothetical protein